MTRPPSTVVGNLDNLLGRLLEDGVTLWLEDERLRYRTASGPLEAALRLELVAHKTELIAILREELGNSAHPDPGRVRPRRRDAPLPLSFAQQRLWFLAQLEGASSTYNAGGAFLVEGRLDVGALERAVQNVVTRHEVLRTSFPTVDDEPVQEVKPELEVPIERIDCTDSCEPETVRAVVAEWVERPFDLGVLPLLRLALVAVDLNTSEALRVTAAATGADDSSLQPKASAGHQAHVLVVVVHHIISDGWSIRLFVRELTTAYAAHVANRPVRLPELEIQYADFALWQRDFMQGGRLQQQLKFWHQHLDGAPDLLELPTDRPRPPTMSFRGGLEQLRLAPQLVEQLEALSRRCGASLFMTLQAAFAALLSRYSGQLDLVVGTAIANRDRSEIEPLIGFFVNTLALRTDLSGRPSFVELLGRVRTTTLAAFEHQSVPFEQVVAHLQRAPSLSHGPLFQVMMTWQNVSPSEFDLEDLQVTPVELGSVGAKFDLDLTLEPVADGIAGTLEYSSDLFLPETARRLLANFTTLLGSIVREPETPLVELPLLTSEEEHQVLVAWNETAKALDPSSLLQLMQRQVARSPDAPAASCARRQRSYRELWQDAEAVADSLRRAGVHPGDVVGLLGDRGIEFLAGVLGILRAGGVYLPVDPQPPERAATVLEQSGARVVLATDGHLEAAGAALGGRADSLATGGRTVIGLPTALMNGAGTPSRKHAKDALGDDGPAYLIYTSGSTGLPKGALISQAGLKNHLLSKIDCLGLRSGEVVIQNASQTFDISIWQLLAGLIVGARIHIVSPELAGDPEALLRCVVAQRAVVLEVVPSLLRLALDQFDEQPEKVPDLSCLRHLMSTGEALPPDLARRWLRRFPNIPVINAYGPTECADDVALSMLREPPADHVVNLPVGKPIQNMQIFVLNEAFQPCPVGVPGELFVAGVGIGIGYLHDARRTAEAFLPCPFGSEPGSRWYRVGDIGRWLADGSIEYLGRNDHQVKIRGFRVELAEIESVLLSHPAVRQSVVTKRDNPAGGMLVAYVALDPAAAPDSGGDPGTIASLRVHLKNKLPTYMVPPSIVLLDRLPLNRNGKIDRRALPDPDLRAVESNFVPPTSNTEHRLAEIWRDVLELENVGVTDSFFDLGGHSLLAARVASRLRSAFGIELQLRTLFEAPTLAELASRVDLLLAMQKHHIDPNEAPNEEEQEIEL